MGSSTPAVSVLLPVRNAAPYLPTCLASLEAQTLGDFEVVAVDDGSQDASRAILDAVALRDPRIRVVPGPGLGIAAALNAGLLHCRARFIARMDADDVARSRRLEVQVGMLERRPRVAAVGSRVQIFPRAGMTDGLRGYEQWLNGLITPDEIRRDRLVESPLVHPAATIRTAALRDVGGWTLDPWPEDYALWLALLEHGRELANAPEVLLDWRDRPDRLTRTHAHYTPDSFVRLKARHLSRTVLRSGKAIVWGAGRTGRALSRALGENGIRVERLVDVDPRKVGRRRHGAPVVAPEDLGRWAGVHLVAAVGAKGARRLIRGFLDARGWREGEQYTCAA